MYDVCVCKQINNKYIGASCLQYSVFIRIIQIVCVYKTTYCYGCLRVIWAVWVENLNNICCLCVVMWCVLMCVVCVWSKAKWTNEWVNEQTDNQTNEKMSEQAGKWLSAWGTNEQASEQLSKVKKCFGYAGWAVVNILLRMRRVLMILMPLQFKPFIIWIAEIHNLSVSLALFVGVFMSDIYQIYICFVLFFFAYLEILQAEYSFQLEHQTRLIFEWFDKIFRKCFVFPFKSLLYTRYILSLTHTHTSAHLNVHNVHLFDFSLCLSESKHYSLD